MVEIFEKFTSDLLLEDKFHSYPVKNTIGNCKVISALSKTIIDMGLNESITALEQPSIEIKLFNKGEVYNIDEQFEILIEQP